MMAGATWREEQEWERAAWAVAHLLNVSGKTLRRDVSAADLLGRPRSFQVRDPYVAFEGLWAEVERLREEDELPEN